jgi:WD40 repeat protein/3',5'-cyclic AMP phosphodiesterase CpdA
MPSPPQQEATAFVVRLLTASGQTAGMGALVAEREILTCAHVVNTALGRDQRAQAPPDGVIMVEFPLLAAVAGYVTGQARVQKWLAPPREDVTGDDLAGLVLEGPCPPGAAPGKLAVGVPSVGQVVDVFGYPQEPSRHGGAWAEAVVRGTVSGGLLQLDGTLQAVHQAQRGYSGSPVCDRGSGRVVGLLKAAPATAGPRDSYAIPADRLRLAWPEVLDRRGKGAAPRDRRRRGAPLAELTVLHLSDPRFRRDDIGLGRLQDDLTGLEAEHGLCPDLMVVTGDLTDSGLPSEFKVAVEFLATLADAIGLPRRQVAIVPGNHDINRNSCASYFLKQEAAERNPVPPYWPKWEQFAAAFGHFYDGVEGVSFAPDEPWTLFEMPDVAVVVAGLNSTIAESHLEKDHYGFLGESQLGWFAQQLTAYRERGWLRLAAIHHNVMQGTGADSGSLRDADDLDRVLGQTSLVNFLLHGQSQDARLYRLRSGLPVLSTGRAMASAEGRPHDGASYQLVTIRPDGVTRHARSYAWKQRRWVGDTRISRTGSTWQVEDQQALADVHGTFAAAQDEPGVGEPEQADPEPCGDAGEVVDDLSDSFMDRVREATSVSFPEATITVRGQDRHGYLRVSNPLPGGGAEQWPVGVIDGGVTPEDLHEFVHEVHAKFAAADPHVRSQLVYAGAPASADLIDQARRLGIWLRTFVDYQGLLDVRPMADSQAEELAADKRYPAELYVPQRYRLLDDPPSAPPRDGLLDQVVDWLDADVARFIMLLGDSGQGKTFLLRQLARTLRERLPGVVPVLVGLRELEKAPSLYELLAQHLVRHGADSVEVSKLRYMVRSGRLALLFDGFDELAVRVSYDRAADYLHTLLEAVSGRAKIVLTSRTQHFQSTSQVRTALGAWVTTLGASRVAVLTNFGDWQIREFLTKWFAGDPAEAEARYELLASIHDLLGLSENPRMLSFVTGLDRARLEAVKRKHDQISAAELYRELVDFWLIGEAQRQRHSHGMLTLDEQDRLTACRALALRLWTSATSVIPPQDLSTEVAATLRRLAERGYDLEQATHTVGSTSLLVRTDEGAFGFVHQSIMEWLVADAAAERLRSGKPADVLEVRPLTTQMADFLCDLAGHATVRGWSDFALAATDTAEIAQINALQLASRLSSADQEAVPMPSVAPANLAGADLRRQDLDRNQLRGANLAGANLRGARLVGTDLTGADLTGADLRGARLVGANLADARLDGVRWQRAALLGVRGLEPAAVTPAPGLESAAIAGRDVADAVVAPCTGLARCVAVSPDSELIAYGQGNTVVLADLATGQPLRVLAGHAGGVSGVAFSPEGMRVATASYDGTARIWDTITGTTLVSLTGHTGRVYGVAFSSNGNLIATASRDRTAQIWDTATGRSRTRLAGHASLVYGVAFSPDGSLVATASYDKTARLWDTATGVTRAVLDGHLHEVYGVAFSPDGSLVATASYDRTARIWDTATGTARTTLTGHTGGVSGVAFSPDGTRVATSSRDRTVRIWDTATGTCRATLRGHAGGVSRVAFSPDGTLVATASRDHTARIWDTETGLARTTLTSRCGGVSDVACSPVGTLVATTCWDRTVRLWETGTGTTLAVLEGHLREVSAVAFSADGTLVATASRDRTARIWDAATGRLRTVLDGHSGGVSGVAFSPDCTLVATACYDHTARIWDIPTGRPRVDLTGHTREVAAVAVSPDGARVATASYDRTGRIWDTSTGCTCITLTGHADGVYGIEFSPDGALVATASRDGTARTWDAATGAPRATLAGHTGGVSAVAFSPNGTLIATASWDNTARIWDAETGAHRLTLTGHTNWVNGVAFSPDGSLIATASEDNTARIWDAATGASIAALLALPDEGSAVLLPDGSYKLDGDPHDTLWWAIKLCRFAPGELDGYDRRIRRWRRDSRILELR